MQLKKYNRAEDLIITSIQTNPYRSALHNLWGRLYIEIGKLDLAEKILLNRFETDKDYPLIPYNLSLIYIMKKDFESALKYNKIAVKNNSINFRLLHQRINLHWELKKFIDVVNFYEKDFKNLKKNKNIFKETCITALDSSAELKDISSYHKILKTINSLEIEQPYILYNLLIAVIKMNDLDTTITILNKFSSMDLNKHFSEEQIKIINKIKDTIIVIDNK